MAALEQRWRRGQTLALDRLHQRIDARRDPAVEIPHAEVRRDRVALDAVRDGVGDRAFEAVADFDPQPAVGFRYYEDHAVLDARATYLPGVGNADRVLLDGLGRSRRDDQHSDLAALRALEIAQPRIEALDL